MRILQHKTNFIYGQVINKSTILNDPKTEKCFKIAIKPEK